MILRTSFQSQPEEGGKEKGDEDGPDEDVPDPFRNVRLGHLDGDGDFPGDSDDFLLFGDFCRDGNGGAFILDAVAEVGGEFFDVFVITIYNGHNLLVFGKIRPPPHIKKGQPKLSDSEFFVIAVRVSAKKIAPYKLIVFESNIIYQI